MKSVYYGLCIVVFSTAVCDGFLFDVRADCLVSTWSTWTPVPGLGMHIRERGVLRYDNQGGTPCPPDDELRQVKTDYNPTTSRHANIQATARSMSANFIRGVANPQNPQATGQKRDLLIILDSSGSIGSSNFYKTKQNLAELLGMLCPDPDPFAQLYQHAALIDFAGSTNEIFDFNKYQHTSTLKNGILAVPYLGGITCTTKAFTVALNMFSKWKGMRTQSDVVQEVLILTDGQSNCGGAVATAAKELQKKATVFTLLIGSFTQIGVSEIASYVTTPVPKHLFAVQQLQVTLFLLVVLYHYVSVNSIKKD